MVSSTAQHDETAMVEIVRAKAALDVWRERTEWPLVGVAVLFLVAYGLPIAADGVPSWVTTACSTTMTLAWLVFAADYTVRLHLSGYRWSFVRANWIDLLVVVLPLLRPLRLLLLVKVLQRFSRTGIQRLRGKVVTYATGGTALLILTSSLAITDAERHAPDATITNLAEGFWWSIVTMTTVDTATSTPSPRPAGSSPPA